LQGTVLIEEQLVIEADLFVQWLKSSPSYDLMCVNYVHKSSLLLWGLQSATDGGRSRDSVSEEDRDKSKYTEWFRRKG